MYTIKEIKDDLKVSDRTVRRWIAGGKLKAIKIQGVVRIKDEEYKRFLEGGNQVGGNKKA